MPIASGLFKAMPFTGTLAIVASAAMAGVPLMNGFLSKEMFFAETVFVSAHPAVEILLPAAATLAGVFAVVYSLRFGHDVFFGPPPTDCPRQPHEPVHWMRVPVELLVLACLASQYAGWQVKLDGFTAMASRTAASAACFFKRVCASMA